MTEANSLITKLDQNLLVNRKQIEQVFTNCEDVNFQDWQYGTSFQYDALSIYCASLASYTTHLLQQALEQVAAYALETWESVTPGKLSTCISTNNTALQPFVLLEHYEQVYEYIMNGYIIIVFDQLDKALAFESGSTAQRQVTEPVNEPAVHGPREGTVENMATNLGMIRQRVRTPEFKVEFLQVGKVIKSKIGFGYLEHVVNQEVLQTFRTRIASIVDYEVLETSYVEDWIEESTLTPFPQVRYTERTDTATAALLDGKIIVLVENSPMIMICPALLVDFMGTAEDYYIRSVFATFIRSLRLLAFIIALTLPSIYIALSTFHPELIPTVLLLAIVDSREGIPFPAFIEALVMEISFELLREAGIRLPRTVGSAVSIVGALVIGQAAIMAKIASPFMVIVVALTGIASFAIPHYDMAIALRVLRFPYMIAASLLGGYGLMVVFLLTLLHLTCLHSLGQPYLSSLAPLKIRDLRDIFIRVPLKQMLKSPRNRRLHSSSRKE
ncbi:spore germination protein [Paenibacillus sinopodophylli]|uniref:spore germination protein n=1 Tax=Paenibacillus sinopodophylli TaxID=1837342 RepID=UPI0014864063|nr:spore germination protein [Paenibacillus sinopodophylli]